MEAEYWLSCSRASENKQDGRREVYFPHIQKDIFPHISQKPRANVNTWEKHRCRRTWGVPRTSASFKKRTPRKRKVNSDDTAICLTQRHRLDPWAKIHLPCAKQIQSKWQSNVVFVLLFSCPLESIQTVSALLIQIHSIPMSKCSNLLQYKRNINLKNGILPWKY